LKKNHKGFSVVEVLLLVIIIGIISLVGWYVWQAKQKKNTSVQNPYPVSNVQDDTSSANGEAVTQQPKEYPKETGTNVSKVPGKYQNSVTGLTFDYPSDWDAKKISVFKTGVTERIIGNHIGPYSPQLEFKKAENKWYGVDEDGKLYVPSSEYVTVTTIPASTYPALLGLEGEGGGYGYYVAFTDGTSLYLIEMPTLLVETENLDTQKQAMPALMASIKLGS
jgi:type II secretory pathway pseudopilin PulG